VGSPYIRARGAAKLVVRQAFPGRPSSPCAMFGTGDALFGHARRADRLLPACDSSAARPDRCKPVDGRVAEAISRMPPTLGMRDSPMSLPA